MALEVEVKRVLNRHRRRDSWFLDDYSVNPYVDCQFGCVYCYIHGSRYGAGIRGLAVKVNAPEVLDRELSRRASRGQYGFVAFSSSTEPWMPLEARYRVSRRCLEALLRHRFPVHCLTKSRLILRDLDLLLRLDGEAVLPQDLNWVGRGVLVTVSLSTLREDLASIFEPGAPKPEERLELVGRLRDRGLKAGVAYIPVLPYLSDGELEEMVRAAAEVDASYVFFGSLTLHGGEPGSSKWRFLRVLEHHFPELLSKYRRLYRGWAPPRRYEAWLEAEARRLCRRYGVSYGIGLYG